MMYDQLIFNMRVAIANAATIAKKYSLMRLYDDSFLNLKETL